VSLLRRRFRVGGWSTLLMQVIEGRRRVSVSKHVRRREEDATCIPYPNTPNNPIKYFSNYKSLSFQGRTTPWRASKAIELISSRGVFEEFSGRSSMQQILAQKFQGRKFHQQKAVKAFLFSVRKFVRDISREDGQAAGHSRSWAERRIQKLWFKCTSECLQGKRYE